MYLNEVVAIVKPCVQLFDTSNAALRAHVAALILGIHFADVGFRNWSYGSGTASASRQGQRECNDRE